MLRSREEAGAPRGTGTGGERVGGRARPPREGDERGEAAPLRPPDGDDSRRAALPAGLLAEPGDAPFTGPALLRLAEPEDTPLTGPTRLPLVEPDDVALTGAALLPLAEPDDVAFTGPALLPSAEPALRVEGAAGGAPALWPPAGSREDVVPAADFSRRAERSRSPGPAEAGRARLRVSREAASAVSEPLRGPPPRRDFVIGPPFRPPSPWR
ncbi:MAG: hypothetical protein IT380_07595 [Myxococcales bacterium]|nr:hypothetical protein [Myxococcales bacterium]